MALSNSAVIKLVLEISKSHATNESIHEHILWTFLNVTINSRIIKGIINQELAIPEIYGILRNHQDNYNIVLLCVTLLNQISTRTTTRVAVAKENGIQVILEMLYSHEGQHVLQMMCLKLIDILCTLSLCRKRIAQEDRLRTLLAWFMKDDRMGKRDYVEAGLNICQKLAMSAAESKQALQDCSGYTFFVTVNSRYNDDQDIQYLTVTGMSSLAEPADYDNESSEEEVLSSDASEDSEDEYDAY